MIGSIVSTARRVIEDANERHAKRHRTPRMWLNDIGPGGRVFCRIRWASDETIKRWNKERRLFTLSGLYLLPYNRQRLKVYRRLIEERVLFVHTGTKTK